MTTPDIAWPKKRREMHSHHFESTVWNDFRFRDGDIIISTYAKSGTTWTQQIVGQLIFNGAENVPVNELSPWLDLRVPPAEVKLATMDAQTHRRFLKTHLPVDALVYSPKARYIYIGRDGRDVLWSMYNHHANANDAFYEALNETPGLVGEKLDRVTTDVRTYFNDWVARDGYPFWSLWENVSSWWAIRHLPNIHFMHFDMMKRDMEGEIRRLARFLDIEVDETRWPAIVEHCTFDYMKKHADKSAPLGGLLWEGGASTFINKGTNGRWRDVLSAEECANYEALAREKLGAECAHWLMTGEGLDVVRAA
ncbi:sulfotransferase [Parvibaculum lavamentivorans DS-1]|uniref:Sulfotransferase n=1 Tax=Parvibaculum lavamentivorans (strain DS-1 / DSM 13023 / NCIMB 13966) TaxID=402881 RepID=A7HVI5_PARL1|nr:sulfotransferase domain-containing protein [Parvibaculum lavamentivorans]ABS63918.1 sulfotransferase [Parvibaculum lavamentivorans DS-1]